MPKPGPIGLKPGSVNGARAARKPAAAQPVSEGSGTAGTIPSHILPLVDAIESAGRDLLHDPTSQSLEQYKKSVRDLLDAALHDSMKLQSEASLGLSRKVFSTITRADIALADLTDLVLRQQHDLLRIKDLINQVKGLVVDLYR